jgi:hypothetical protein
MAMLPGGADNLAGVSSTPFHAINVLDAFM